MLELSGISKTLGNFRLADIDLAINTGEYFVVLGPSGAGKTILLETIAGIYSPDSGKIILEGKDITASRPKDRDMGMVYQDYMLFPHLNVEQNIGFGLKKRRIKPGVIAREVGDAADMLNIGNLLSRSTTTLSGGEQQRVALARALVFKPRILLLDEPLSALDITTREKLRRELKDIHQKTGTTIMHITHHFEDLYALADRAGVMQEGRIVQVGTPDEIFRKPRTEFVANFTGMENIFRGQSSVRGLEGMIAIGQVTISTLTDIEGDVVVGIRPEELIVSRQAIESSAVNSLEGVVSTIRVNGMFSRIDIDAGIPLVAMVTRKSVDRMGLKPGHPVWVTFKASAVHVFAA